MISCSRGPIEIRARGIRNRNGLKVHALISKRRTPIVRSNITWTKMSLSINFKTTSDPSKEQKQRRTLLVLTKRHTSVRNLKTEKKE
jgi:hypothetical protein